MNRFKRTILWYLAGLLLWPSFASAAFDPNDPWYSRQGYLQQIGAPKAWEVSIGSSEVIVAVIDTGVDINHPDLIRSIWRNEDEVAGDKIDNDKNGFIDDAVGWDFVDNSNDPRPSAVVPYSFTALHHGTLVAGIIAATGNNREGTVGLAWRTKIMPLRALDKDGVGDVAEVAQAVNYAIDNGAKIINLSFVGDGFNEQLYSALRRAYDAGVLVIVAAGNNSANLNRQPRYPVCYDAPDDANWLLGVSAVDPLDQHVSTANYGSECVDLVAPGSQLYSTQVVDEAKGLMEPYGGPWSGTSLAAPIVTGVAALIKAAYPKLSVDQIIQVLISSADDISELNINVAAQLGGGRVNADRALTGAATPGVPPPRVSTVAAGRIIAAANNLQLPAIQLYTGGGVVQQLWYLFDKNDFMPGGGVAVAENARDVPFKSNFKISDFSITALLRGEQRVVLGEGSKGKGRVRVVNTLGIKLHEWLAFDKNFAGSVAVATGDLFGFGEEVIAVMPGSEGGPLLRVFTREGKLMSQFFVYDTKLRGGWSVAMADLDGDGQAEFVVGSTTIELPVRVYRFDGKFMYEWDAFAQYKGGVTLAGGDLNGDGRDEVVVSTVKGGGPQVKIFGSNSRLLGQFMAFNDKFRGGVNLAVGDINSDGKDEIAAIPRSNGGPQVRFFDGSGRLLGQFFVYPSDTRFGTNIAIIR